VSRSTSFYFAFLTLPAPRRRAIFAVFDFCRTVDDAVDLEPDPARAREAVAEWRGELDRVFGSGQPDTAVGRALQPHVETFGLTRANFDALIDGVEMDIEPRRYETFADLEAYCHRVASAVGLMCVEIFDARSAGAGEYARDLGVALQLTNILRDVGVDFRQGRVYLPQEDLARFGASERDIAQAVEAGGSANLPASLRAALEHQAARARVFFSRAVRALPADQRPRLVAAEVMREIYADLLRRIEARNCDVFSGLVRVPPVRRVSIAIRTWLRLRSLAGTPRP
jgi:phytoene synthase